MLAAAVTAAVGSAAAVRAAGSEREETEAAVGSCRPTCRGLHSSTSQLNLSRVWHKTTPYTPLITP